MSANKFLLKHDDLEVEYTIGLNPGLPAVIYQDGSPPAAHFTSAEITTDATALGSLISFLLQKTVDSGGERFAFFLPQVDVSDGDSAQFITVGLYERFGGPESVSRLPPSWQVIELQGTAQSVVVPL
jgi:hypothetical protein